MLMICVICVLFNHLCSCVCVYILLCVLRALLSVSLCAGLSMLQRITMVDSATYTNLHLDCLTNCDPAFNPTERLALRVYCQDCATWSYHWSMTGAYVIPPELDGLQVVVVPPRTIKGNNNMISVVGEKKNKIVLIY